MKKITVMLVAFACLTVLLLSTCKKETANGNSTVAVRLQDAPGHWDRCMVEVRGIRLFSSVNGWITIPISDTVIDILQLQDTSVLLGMVNLNAGTITEADLLLGVHDSITIGGATFVVSFLAGDSDDVAIKVNDTILPGGSFTLVLDLNAAQSFYQGDDGGWHMHGHMGQFFRRDWDDHDHGWHHRF
jgi:hypothetical protein